MTSFDISWWVWFNLGMFVLLVLDLKFIPQKRHHSYLMTAGWISIAMLFALLLYLVKGSQIALEFTTGYLIEESLSVDNLFVFLMLFKHFHVPSHWQRKILMYGIIGALVMRLIFIIVGISLVQQAHWMLLLFGAFLAVTGILMFKKPEKDYKPKPSFLVQLAKKVFPFTDSWEADTFFVRQGGKLFATPALLVLCTVESTDLLFALDSIPAVFAITLDPFIVYSCNALAIVGLRSIFFALRDLLEIFEHLHYGVSLILVFVGCKMLIAPFYTIDTATSLTVIGCLLVASIIGPPKLQRKK